MDPELYLDAFDRMVVDSVGAIQKRGQWECRDPCLASLHSCVMLNWDLLGFTRHILYLLSLVAMAYQTGKHGPYHW